MGIQGLTTYLRENKRILSSTLELSTNAPRKTQIIVDAWAFIYEVVHKANLPWVYGGQYPELGALMRTVVNAWLKVGFELSFVFDGPYPELKHDTIISRATQSFIQPAQLFFRTSASSRSTPRFLHETRIIPPLSYAATIDTLVQIQSTTDSLHLYFADEEGDPYCVELASRLGAYVIGNDSDFVVLNADGYLGYVPLDDMLWTTNTPEPTPSIDKDDDDFQQARRPKTKKKPQAAGNLGRGLIPPDNASELHLSFTVYNPSSLASHLSLPVSLLPLLGAVLGNDFSKQTATRQNLQYILFERQSTNSARINLVASTIRGILAAGARKPKDRVDSVMDLISKTITALLTLLPTAHGSGEVDSIVDKVVESTLQYAIPKHEGSDLLRSSGVCPLHEPDVCPLVPSFSRLAVEEALQSNEETQAFLQRVDIRALYMDAYRTGKLAPVLVNSLSAGTAWPRLFLENPDVETVGIITRPLRQLCYSIFDDAIGLPPYHPDGDDVAQSVTTSSDGDIVEATSDDDSDDEEQLVDVIEDHSDDGSAADILGPLRGALDRMHDPDNNSTLPTLHQNSHPPMVVEYVRRGGHLSAELVEVPRLSESLTSVSLSNLDDSSLLLQPVDVRLTAFLRFVNADCEQVRALPREQLIPALTVRWVSHALLLRAKEKQGWVHESARWTVREAQCFLGAFAWEHGKLLDEPSEFPVILDRNIQLVAQAAQTMEALQHLTQVLLLTDSIPSPALRFSGKLFHWYAANMNLPVNIAPMLWEACVAGPSQIGVWREEKSKKAKKQAVNPASPSRKPIVGRASMFSMLDTANA